MENENKLPEIKPKKKININKFVKRAKILKKYFEEEIEHLRKKGIEDENLLSGRSI